MFEEEAEEYANIKEIERNNLECVIVINHEVFRAFKDGATFGYNKAKEEMQEQGLALQSDMDKTIEQNIALKKELNKANEWHYPSKGELPKEDTVEKETLYLLWFGLDDSDYMTGLFSHGRFWCFDSGWFETNEVIAWKEIVLPEEIKEND